MNPGISSAMSEGYSELRCSTLSGFCRDLGLWPLSLWTRFVQPPAFKQMVQMSQKLDKKTWKYIFIFFVTLTLDYEILKDLNWTATFGFSYFSLCSESFSEAFVEPVPHSCSFKDVPVKAEHQIYVTTAIKCTHLHQDGWQNTDKMSQWTFFVLTQQRTTAAHLL